MKRLSVSLPIIAMALLSLLSACQSFQIPDKQAREDIATLKEEWSTTEARLKEIEETYSDARLFLEELRAAGGFPDPVSAVRTVVDSLERIEEIKDGVDDKIAELNRTYEMRSVALNDIHEDRAAELQAEYDDRIQALTEEGNALLNELDDSVDVAQSTISALVAGMESTSEEKVREMNTLISGFEQTFGERLENADTNYAVRLRGIENELDDFRSDMTRRQETDITGLNQQVQDMRTALQTLIVGYVKRIEDVEAMAAEVPKLRRELQDMRAALETAGASIQQAGSRLEEAGSR